jgi:hypothetical protein
MIFANWIESVIVMSPSQSPGTVYQQGIGLYTLRWSLYDSTTF